MGVRVVTDSACDLPDDAGRARSASRSCRSPSASATRSSSTARSSAPTSSGVALERLRRPARDRGTVGRRVRGRVPRRSRTRRDRHHVHQPLVARCRRRCSRRRSRPQAVAGDCPVAGRRLAERSMGLGSLCLTAARRAADGDSLESIVAEVVTDRDRTKLFGGARHARVPQEGRPRRQRPGAARLDAVDQAGHRGPRRRGRGGGQGPHPFEGAAAAGRPSGARARSSTSPCSTATRPISTSCSTCSSRVCPSDEIIVGQIGPVIGTHAGPRVIGVTFQART